MTSPRMFAFLAALYLAAFTLQVSAGTTAYKYDAIGRVIQVSYPDGSIVYYE
jgi:YD repeat-containing protein